MAAPAAGQRRRPAPRLRQPDRRKPGAAGALQVQARGARRRPRRQHAENGGARDGSGGFAARGPGMPGSDRSQLPEARAGPPRPSRQGLRPHLTVVYRGGAAAPTPDRGGERALSSTGRLRAGRAGGLLKSCKGPVTKSTPCRRAWDAATGPHMLTDSFNCTCKLLTVARVRPGAPWTAARPPPASLQPPQPSHSARTVAIG